MNVIGKKKKNYLRLVVQGLPLAAVVGATFLTSQRLGGQLLMLIVLLWVQTFFILECFLTKK
jgi:fatty acid desaturase